ncbi:MAG: hypothetical protein KatS3mg104_1557 [Phycisphaerae bacterium]|nr:MAG: hypothetical protein KatS3mg104_1557 [Phycisphaerae bacterium]
MAEDFEATKVDFEHLYTGWRELTVPVNQIETLYTDKQLKLQTDPPLWANEFVLLRDESNPDHTAVARYKADLSALIPPSTPQRTDLRNRTP